MLVAWVGELRTSSVMSGAPGNVHEEDGVVVIQDMVFDGGGGGLVFDGSGMQVRFPEYLRVAIMIGGFTLLVLLMGLLYALRRRLGVERRHLLAPLLIVLVYCSSYIVLRQFSMPNSYYLLRTIRTAYYPLVQYEELLQWPDPIPVWQFNFWFDLS